ncbi:acyl carrier protein [Gordonia sp. CPCC 206044]|uniref:acyl carrier protein n=1 Tax=Gordonia sp. CPCC 206044 TaxID=3140793 RepID=UPI003AF3FA0F
MGLLFGGRLTPADDLPVDDLWQPKVDAREDEVEMLVREAVSDIVGLPPMVVDRYTDLAEYGVDSVDAVELMVALEEDFDIRVPGRDLELLSTVDRIVDYVHSVVGNRAVREAEGIEFVDDEVRPGRR